MVGIVSRMLNEQITWWSVTPDGYGGNLFAAPQLITGRWEERQEVYIGQLDRQERVSKAIVYVDRAVAVGDYLMRGDQTLVADPTTLADADKVQRYQKFPDLRSLEALHKAIL